MTTNLAERLQDSNERFAPSEIFQLFEHLAEQYGFHRSPDLPPRHLTVETVSMTVPHFEEVGVIVVRPQTVNDSMVSIPNLVDRILGNNLQPSQNSTFNAQLIALARTVIVSPPHLVDEILMESDDDFYMNRSVQVEGKSVSKSFFLEFAKEYNVWKKARAEEARKKKSGSLNGSESAS